MGAIGYGEFRPRAANDSDINRQKNRRVVIRVMTGEDMFAGSSPFADTEVDSTIPVDQAPEAPATILQAGEPARSIFGAP